MVILSMLIVMMLLLTRCLPLQPVLGQTVDGGISHLGLSLRQPPTD